MIDLAPTTAPITMEERYGTFAGAGSGMPSLGVLWLAALARRAGYSVEVLECAALGLGYGEMVRRLEELRPRVLGISATTVSIGQSAKLAGMVKERLPATLVVLGGPHATAMPPETLEKTRRFALSLPLTDISVTAMTPLPGTEIYHTAAAHGDFDNRWEKMNLLETIFVPHGLSAETMARCQRTMLRQFYLRPRIIWAYIVRLLRNPGMAAGALRGLAAFLRTVRA